MRCDARPRLRRFCPPLLLLLTSALPLTATSGPAEVRLNRSRFAVEVQWRRPDGTAGRGHGTTVSDDSAYFWFFRDTNVELFLKVLDGRPINGHFWVFYGALSNVEYTITVTDTDTGQVRRYDNPQGHQASRGDTEAFDAGAGGAGESGLLSWPLPRSTDEPSVAQLPPRSFLDGSHTGKDIHDTGTEPERSGHQHCEDGTAAGFPCHRVEMLSLLPLSELFPAAPPESANDIWGWTDAATGREYALVGLANGTAFVDLHDAERPLLLGTLPTATQSSPYRDIKTYRDHAYIVADSAGSHGMQVFDLRRLRNVPDPPLTLAADTTYRNIGSAHNLAINEETGFAYVVGSEACAGGLHMVDLSQPKAPRFAGCFGADGYTHDAHCVVYRGRDAAYRGREICFASNEDTLTVVDVTNKAAARMLSRTTYAGVGYTHQGWLLDGHVYFLLGDELDEQSFGHNSRTYIWDVSDLDAPRVLSIYEGSSPSIDHNIYSHRGYAFEANYTSGLRILDLENVHRGTLREVASFDVVPEHDEPVFAGSWSVYPYFESGHVVLTGIGEGLFVLRPLLPGFDDLQVPSDLTALLVDLDVELAWELESGRALGVRIYRQQGNAPFEPLVELAAAATAYVDRGVAADTVYRYRVVTFDGDEESGGAEVEVATPTLPTTCPAQPTDLCLGGGRYLLQLAWAKANGETGRGTPVPLTPDSAYFWFFRDSNVELVVKFLDGTPINGHRWLFYGSLTNVQFTLRVIDTEAGRLRVYRNPAGSFGSVGDTTAFDAD